MLTCLPSPYMSAMSTLSAPSASLILAVILSMISLDTWPCSGSGVAGCCCCALLPGPVTCSGGSEEVRLWPMKGGWAIPDQDPLSDSSSTSKACLLHTSRRCRGRKPQCLQLSACCAGGKRRRELTSAAQPCGLIRSILPGQSGKVKSEFRTIQLHWLFSCSQRGL